MYIYICTHDLTTKTYNIRYYNNNQSYAIYVYSYLLGYLNPSVGRAITWNLYMQTCVILRNICVNIMILLCINI